MKVKLIDSCDHLSLFCVVGNIYKRAAKGEREREREREKMGRDRERETLEKNTQSKLKIQTLSVKGKFRRREWEKI